MAKDQVKLILRLKYTLDEEGTHGFWSLDEKWALPEKGKGDFYTTAPRGADYEAERLFFKAQDEHKRERKARGEATSPDLWKRVEPEALEDLEASFKEDLEEHGGYGAIFSFELVIYVPLTSDVFGHIWQGSELDPLFSGETPWTIKWIEEEPQSKVQRVYGSSRGPRGLGGYTSEYHEAMGWD